MLNGAQGIVDFGVWWEITLDKQIEDAFLGSTQESQKKNKSSAKKKAEYVAKPGFSLDRKIFAARV